MLIVFSSKRITEICDEVNKIKHAFRIKKEECCSLVVKILAFPYCSERSWVHICLVTISVYVTGCLTLVYKRPNERVRGEYIMTKICSCEYRNFQRQRGVFKLCMQQMTLSIPVIRKIEKLITGKVNIVSRV